MASGSDDLLETESFAFEAESCAWKKDAAAAILLGDEAWPAPGDATDARIEGPGGINAMAGLGHVFSQKNAVFEAGGVAAAMVVGDEDWSAPGNAQGGGGGLQARMTAVGVFRGHISLDNYAFEANAAAATMGIGEGGWPANMRDERELVVSGTAALPATMPGSPTMSAGDVEGEEIAPGPIIAASWSEVKVIAGGVLGFGKDPSSVEGGDLGYAHLEAHLR